MFVVQRWSRFIESTDKEDRLPPHLHNPAAGVRGPDATPEEIEKSPQLVDKILIHQTLVNTLVNKWHILFCMTDIEPCSICEAVLLTSYFCVTGSLNFGSMSSTRCPSSLYAWAWNRVAILWTCAYIYSKLCNTELVQGPLAFVVEKTWRSYIYLLLPQSQKKVIPVLISE